MSVATTTTTATDPSRPSIDLVTSSCCMVRSLSRCGSMSTTRPLIKISLHNDKDVKILKDRLHNKELLIFLDYDGTLTPIVSNPGDAKLSSQMAGVLERLSLLHRVSIVTGRSMDTILSFLRGAFLQQQHDGGGGHDAILKRIHYAASHGFDIKGPNDTHYQVGRAYLPQLYEARDRLIKEAQKYPHCVVEDNKFSISVHYRNVHPDLHVEVSDMVHSIVARYPHLRLHYGKMVYEIKLNLSWNKGKAVLWLLNAWDVLTTSAIHDNDEEDTIEDHHHHNDDDDDDTEYDGNNDHVVIPVGVDTTTSGILPIYIGDDITDEDGFRAIKASFPTNGMGILVHNSNHELGRPTAATYTLENTHEVMEFLELLCSVKEDASS